MTAMLTWLEDALNGAGLVVVPYPGWETRTTRAGGLTVKGIVCHHTVTKPSTSNEAVARLLANGRRGLRGPLSHLGLDRDGHFWLIAAGRCNHNGYGTWGNDSIGIEAFNDGVGEPWPDKQIDAFERGCAALIHRCGLSIAEVRGHKETDPARKVDPRGIDMDTFRARVADHLNPPSKDEDDMAPYTLIRVVGDTQVWRVASDGQSKVAVPGPVVATDQAYLRSLGYEAAAVVRDVHGDEHAWLNSVPTAP